MLKAGQYERAIADFDKLIERNPKDIAAIKQRGTAWSGKFKYDKAIADFTKVLAIDPRDPEVWGSRRTPGWPWVSSTRQSRTTVKR